jgi:hypothetical protein
MFLKEALSVLCDALNQLVNTVDKFSKLLHALLSRDLSNMNINLLFSK